MSARRWALLGRVWLVVRPWTAGCRLGRPGIDAPAAVVEVRPAATGRCGATAVPLMFIQLFMRFHAFSHGFSPEMAVQVTRNPRFGGPAGLNMTSISTYSFAVAVKITFQSCV